MIQQKGMTTERPTGKTLCSNMFVVIWLSQNYQIHNKSINILSLQLYTYPPTKF
jgi:hypothetical protein